MELFNYTGDKITICTSWGKKRKHVAAFFLFTSVDFSEDT